LLRKARVGRRAGHRAGRGEGQFALLKALSALWVAPFPDDSPFSPVNIGFGWKWPVRDRLEDTLTGVLIIEWSFGT
jgi:hypothetical protein